MIVFVAVEKEVHPGHPGGAGVQDCQAEEQQGKHAADAEKDSRLLRHIWVRGKLRGKKL